MPSVIGGGNNKSIRSGFYIQIHNKTDKVIYIDKANCFKIDTEGKSECYYDNSEIVTTNNGSSGGISLGIGSLSNVLGIDGAVGTLAEGIIVGGGNTKSVSTTYNVQRVIAIPPLSKKNLTENYYIKTRRGTLSNSGPKYKILELVEDYGDVGSEIKKGIVNKGQTKIFGEDELKWNNRYYITYSKNENFNTYSSLNFEIYIHELIGGAGDRFDARDNEKYIEGMDNHTLHATIDF